MTGTRKTRVAARFHAAAAHYDRHSPVQRRVAATLARAILQQPLAPRPRVLEIGCGTGHLTRGLAPRLAGADWLATDIALGMVTACRAAAPRPTPRFLVMDGERPALRGPFDLICASLAAQWFEDLPGTLARLADLLAPGGLLALSSLGADTFREWRAAHATLGLQAATPEFCDLAAFERAWPPAREVRVWDQILEIRHPSAIDFVRSLRAIGADTPAPGRRPLAPGELRQVLAWLDAQAPVRATYHVLYGLLRKG